VEVVRGAGGREEKEEANVRDAARKVAGAKDVGGGAAVAGWGAKRG